MNGYHWYRGAVDEVRMYNRALSATEIKEAYRNSVGTSSFSNLAYTNYPIQQINLSNKTSLPVYIEIGRAHV